MLRDGGLNVKLLREQSRDNMRFSQKSKSPGEQAITECAYSPL